MTSGYVFHTLFVYVTEMVIQKYNEGNRIFRLEDVAKY